VSIQIAQDKGNVKTNNKKKALPRGAEKILLQRLGRFFEKLLSFSSVHTCGCSLWFPEYQIRPEIRLDSKFD